MNAPLKLGANLWNQYVEWPRFLEGMLQAEELGYDSLWTWDHVYPIVGSWEGPAFETYTAMAAVAAHTRRATVGHLVTANTFRNPALVAKMITTIDHISNGRAVLGIGAAWMEPEHTGFGIEFGDRPGTRLRWLEQSLQVITGMLAGQRPSSAEADRYEVSRALNLPAPVQKHVPILIGGSGPKVTLRLVAQYADMNNLGNPIGPMIESDAILRQHCERLGRDERTIERTVELQRVVIRDTRAAALEREAELLAHNGGAVDDEDRPGSAGVESERIIAGNPDEVVEQLKPYLDAGYRHLICGFPPPYDDESMRRLATEVRPQLETLV
ncbi:MAG: LLM class flavin-dependent oxidoreductase [Chloroflexota bacterium]|jgi:alkanesulfonate monooxygenase SsuD/methylene tetrahydromethanopterin reductase-like flavin-dependent oxidoreductase (luciferase family)